MRQKRYLIVISLCLACSLLFISQNAQCQPNFKDPFESYLPQDSEEYASTHKGKDEDLGPPPITIEGVLWGTKIPGVIIDGEVYKVGDTLITIDAKVFKIKENVVFITYGERIFEMSVKTRGGM
jgi:hypothetical protein